LRREAAERLPVHLDAQAGLPRQRDLAALELELVGHQLLPEERVAQVGGEELDERAVRGHRGEVSAGGNADPRLPGVGDDEPAPPGGKLAHAARLGEAADAPHVGLGDVDQPAVHEVLELEARGEPLAGSHPDTRLAVEPRVARDVIARERRLDEEEVELPPVAERPERGVGVRPGVLDVHQQGELRADGLAARGHDFRGALIGFLEAAMLVGAAESDLHLPGR
jgi:hypothetical protein